MKLVEVSLRLLITLVLVAIIHFRTSSASLSKDDKEPLAAVDKFRALVVPKIPTSSYLQNYINDDLYFTRWLKEKSFDISAAERMFLNHLKWRKENKVDNIHTEDWSEMQKDCPMYFGTVDKVGRPSTEVYWADCPMRDLILAGKYKQLERWMIHLLEMSARDLYSTRRAGHTNVSQVVSIFDYNGYNSVQHACLSCLPWYVNTMSITEHNYFGNYFHVYFIDCPPMFETVMNLMRPVMNPSSKDVGRMIANKAVWMKELDEAFDKSQRSTRFGGTIVRDEN